MIKKIKKSIYYSRIRQYFPMPPNSFTDDREKLDAAQKTLLNWPKNIKKPRIGIVQDYYQYPSWTKHISYCENNSLPYGIYPIQNHDWLEKANDYDVIVGVTSCSSFELDELRIKYHLLETVLNKPCYPSSQNILLYENKFLEAALSKIYEFPFIPTFVSYNKIDALSLIKKLNFPVVSKIVPSSGSLGVELVRTPAQAEKIIQQAFSQNGRKIHIVYSRQKNYIYFQNFIPNEGYDIRIIVIGNLVSGYYRKAPNHDFRASGMHQEQYRSLPKEAMKIARSVNKVIKSPMIAVDMLHGLDGNYYINEFSPYCEFNTVTELLVDGISGTYVFDNDDSYHFEPGNRWVYELALNEFFQNFYLPKIMNKT